MRPKNIPSPNGYSYEFHHHIHCTVVRQWSIAQLLLEVFLMFKNCPQGKNVARGGQGAPNRNVASHC